jgi:enoyl-CoA hydratase/carnithine racemase
MGTVIRSALARAGIDAAQATRLCLADEAAAALVALTDTPELERAEGNSPAGGEAQGRAPADDFSPKILALARGFADGPPPDFAKASFAELYAWSLAQPPAE